MQLLISIGGALRCLYDEAIDLSSLGQLNISRGSHVEPDHEGHWFTDLAPTGGPKLGPFSCRSQALVVERSWLEDHWLNRCDC
jgi:hypothetical protein